VSVPATVFVKPAVPAKLAEMVPVWATNATVSLVSVPFCRTPATSVEVPERLTVKPPRSSTPLETVMLPEEAPRALALPTISEPLVSVVFPE